MMKKIFGAIVLVLVLISCEDSSKTESTETVQVEETHEDSLGWINKQILANPNKPELYILKAKYNLSQKDLEGAVVQVDKAIGLDSNNLDFYTFKGDAQYNGDDILGAKQTYLQILEKDEQNIHANMQMAWVSLIAGLHEVSFGYCNEVLKVNQYLPEPYYVKGLCYKELGNFKLSVSNFRTATEQDNDYLEAWLQLGAMYDAAEDTLAGAFYENALRIDSNNIDALYAFGVHLQTWELSEDAIAQYQHILRVDNDYHDAFFNLGYIYLEQLQENDSAVKYFGEVVTLNPFNYKGYYNRGVAYERSGNMPMAETDYAKALELKADYTPAAEGMSRIK